MRKGIVKMLDEIDVLREEVMDENIIMDIAVHNRVVKKLNKMKRRAKKVLWRDRVRLADLTETACDVDFAFR